MAVTELLSRLVGVRKSGADRWMARCPAHADRGPSLSIRQADDRVLVHCFAGCGTDDVLAAVGMTFADVMPERIGHYRPAIRPAFPPSDVLEILGHDVLLALIAANEIRKGNVLADGDVAALASAADRCAKALEYVRGR